MIKATEANFHKKLIRENSSDPKKIKPRKYFLTNQSPSTMTNLMSRQVCLVKDCREHISKPLSHILNLSITSGKVPRVWKKTKIILLYKSSDSMIYQINRAISILPVRTSNSHITTSPSRRKPSSHRISV